MINKLHSESRLQSAKPDHDYVNELLGKAAVHSDVAATVPVMVNHHNFVANVTVAEQARFDNLQDSGLM